MSATPQAVHKCEASRYTGVMQASDHARRVPSRSDLATHRAWGQPDLSAQPGLWDDDRFLQTLAGRAGGDAAALSRFAAKLESHEVQEAALAARRDKPRLHLFDRDGRRADEVRHTPGYHQLMRLGLEHGYAASPWEVDGNEHVTHAAMVYLLTQVEPGVCCPLTMTYAGIPTLAADPALSATWRPGLTARAYDPRLLPVSGKVAVTLGMAMTEKQGGSDVRLNETRAEKTDDGWLLTGHKWFCSAPMSDGFLTLAQAPRGLSCFLLPRWLESGRNRFHIQRLKDKLGNVANASAEVEFDRAHAFLLGEEGAGVRTIITMVQHTRLDTAMAPAGLMRAALAQAVWWCQGRCAFGARLINQPLMARVLADLALDASAALALGLRVARAFGGKTAEERAFARIAVSLAKFINNKRCVHVTAEAMEVMGGMGYVDDTPLPMLYREAPLNGIWEGSGNVIGLDILRSLARDPGADAALMAALEQGAGKDAGYDRGLACFRERWASHPEPVMARAFADDAAQLLSAATLLDMADTAPWLTPLASGFIAGRITQPRPAIAGAGIDLDAASILRAWNGPRLQER